MWFHHGMRGQLSETTMGVLTALGEDRDTVAASLEAMAVQGVAKDPEHCAIASYLSAVISSDPEVSSVKVPAAAVIVVTRSRSWRRKIYLSTPNAVQDFVRAFDAGRFPKLTSAAPWPSIAEPGHASH